MKNYELVLIVNSGIGEDEMKKTLTAVKDLVTSFSGKLKKETSWGEKKFTYSIKKMSQGNYFLFELEFPPDQCRGFDEKLKLEENIIRYLIISV